MLLRKMQVAVLPPPQRCDYTVRHVVLLVVAFKAFKQCSGIVLSEPMRLNSHWVGKPDGIFP